ncbi:MAG: hypothetical protein QOD83_4717 [Solirubrobacteraceae bacterium]|jgi:uncharacterized membrane protein|nr:hypothetical protein [Solirubrobacteraceae bacterium]
MPSPDASSAGESKPQPQSQSLRDRLSHILWPVKPPPPVNPALLKHAEQRAEDAQNRAADHITAFSGSMLFVYIHIIWFASWIGFGVEKYPFGLLTMIVSLEAIFLSTFVMISQNRADAKRQVIADQQWKTVQEEDRQNKELLDLSKQILELTKEVRSYGDTVQAEKQQNKELLDLSRQTFALTKQVHSLAGNSQPDPSQPGMAGTP